MSQVKELKLRNIKKFFLNRITLLVSNKEKGSHHKTMRDDVIDFEFVLSFIVCFTHGKTLW